MSKRLNVLNDGIPSVLYIMIDGRPMCPVCLHYVDHWINLSVVLQCTDDCFLCRLTCAARRWGSYVALLNRYNYYIFVFAVAVPIMNVRDSRKSRHTFVKIAKILAKSRRFI